MPALERPQTARSAATCADIQIRKSSMRDLPVLLRLINSYATQGVMLPRTEFEMAENLRDFTVACEGERLLGCGALHFYTAAMGEVRSLAVEPEWKSHGIGRRLVEALEAEAASHGLHGVFAFTYVPGFFRKLGYAEVDRGALPLKAWKDCLRCPKFQCCDEIAVIKPLIGGGMASLIGGVKQNPDSDFEPLVQLPAVEQSH